MAVSPDGKTLFVANADNNDVMVVDISDATLDDSRDNGESVSMVDGFIPVGWYPTALAVSAPTTALSSSPTARAWLAAQLARRRRAATTAEASRRFDHIGKTLEGSVSFIARPDAAQMAAYTEQVRRNSPYTPEQFRHAPINSDSVIPERWASRARSSTSSTSSRRTAPTTRSSAT